MSKFVLSVLCVVAFAAVIWAQQPPARTTNYNALIGGSDAIVLAGVTEATIPELPTTGGGGFGGNNTGTATVTVKVTKVYAGTVSEASLTLSVGLTANRPGGGGPGGGGAARPTVWTPDVSVGKNVVIGLVKSQAGWSVGPVATQGTGGGFGGGFGAGTSYVYTEAEATAIATAIAAYPVKATVTAPATPLTIGEKATFTITVKNTGATAVTLGTVAMTTIQDSAKLASSATLVFVSDDSRDANNQPRTIAAGAEGTITAVFNVVGPPNWQLFDPKAFPMASQVSASLTVSAAGTGGGGGAARRTNYAMKSEWVDAQLVAPKA